VVAQLAALDRPTRPGIRWTTEDQWHVTLRFLGEVGEEELERVKGALERLGSVRPSGPAAAVGPAGEQAESVNQLEPVVASAEPAGVPVGSVASLGVVVASSGPVRVASGDLLGRVVASAEPAGVPVGSIASLGPVTADMGPAVERLGPSVLCLPVAGLDQVAAAVVQATTGLGAPPEKRRFRGHLTIARVSKGVTPRLDAPIPLSASWEVDEVTLVASTLHSSGAHYEVLARYRLAR
jgi:2'-5' RNA ligase